MAMTLGDVARQAARAHRRAGPQGASRGSRGRTRNRLGTPPLFAREPCTVSAEIARPADLSAGSDHPRQAS